MVTFSQRNEYDMEKEKKIAIKSMKKLNFILIQILRILSFCLSFELLISALHTVHSAVCDLRFLFPTF